MKSFFSLLFFAALMSSCVDCKTCTYYEENASGNVTYEEELAGEYCGDEFRALEKKEYATTGTVAEAYVRCD